MHDDTCTYVHMHAHQLQLHLCTITSTFLMHKACMQACRHVYISVCAHMSAYHM